MFVRTIPRLVAGFVLSLALVVPAAPAAAHGGSDQRWGGDHGALVDDPDRPFDEYTWVTSHNAYERKFAIGNQTKTIREQLDGGVRGLMLDTHSSNGEVKLCHNSCSSGSRTLVDAVRDDIVPFLGENRSAVVTLHLEDYTVGTELGRALSSISGMAGLTFSPDWWPESRWPTLREMVDGGQRLIIFTSKSENRGTYRSPQVPSGVTVLYDRDGTVENHWSMGDTIFTHDRSCTTRWSGTPLTSKTVKWAGKNWRPLFVMNHFHGVPEEMHARTDNRFDLLQQRVDSYCKPAAGRTPNFVALDHVHQGDPIEYASVLTQGGIVFYEGNNATQDIVCGLPGRYSLSINAQSVGSHGCENDEARSARIVNAKAGMRFTVYDSPSGSTGDDWTEIAVLRDAPSITINSFQVSRNDGTVRVTHHSKNGLDGKISRFVVSPAVADIPAPSEPGPGPEPEPEPAPEPAPLDLSAVILADSDGRATIGGTATPGSTITATSGGFTKSTTSPSGSWQISIDKAVGSSTWRVRATLENRTSPERSLQFWWGGPCSDKGSHWDPECRG
jgi:hypothetical protein